MQRETAIAAGSRASGADRILEDTDPITLEIIRYALESIPDQIEVDITRTAYSPSIYDYKDFAVGMVDAEGRLICQGKGGVPLFLANVLGLAARDALLLYGHDDMGPGDVIISNHAPTFGQHLNNVAMLTPVMDPGGELFGFMCVFAHWLDVGGKVVGSHLVNDTTEIFQEGIQFRSVKLRQRGEPVPEIYRMIECNTRFPVELLGDVEAQLAGCMKGRQLFEEILAKNGTTTVRAAIETMWRQSAAAARAAVRAIPDGTYAAESFFDNDGVDLDRPIRIAIAVTVQGEEMTIDFSGVSEQVRGPFNAGANGGGITAARIAFKYLTTPDEPANEGSFEPLRVVLPPGKFLSAGPTAPLAKYSTPMPTVIDTIIHALAPAVPDRVAAGHHSDMGSHRFSGMNPRTGSLFLAVNTANGGWGASRGRDGPGPFKTLSHGDTQDIPAEAVEALYPLAMNAKTWRTDSGGVGEFRGGLGVAKEYIALAPCKLTLTFDRQLSPPWGLFGGLDGARAYAEIERPGKARERYLKIDGLQLETGDRVFLYSGGGGGYGRAIDRMPSRVAEDVRDGYVTVEAARTVYGVALIADNRVDDAETARLRKTMADAIR